MKLRGHRKCRDCESRWSYFETGSVDCPHCGSRWSVATEEHSVLHTDSPVDFDFDDFLEPATSPQRIDELMMAITRRCRSYLGDRGFIVEGTLNLLDEHYLCAAELKWAAHDWSHRFPEMQSDPSPHKDVPSPNPIEDPYIRALLSGTRPRPDSVPEPFRWARSLGSVDAIDDYRSELLLWIDEQGDEFSRPDPAILTQIDAHSKRIRALNGEVSAEMVELLVEAVRVLSRGYPGDIETAEADAVSLLRAIDA